MGNVPSVNVDANVEALRNVLSRYEQFKTLYPDDILNYHKLYSELQPELQTAFETVSRGSSPAQVQSVDTSRPEGRRYSALIVDDSHLSCKLASRTLENLNISSKVAYSGESALLVLRNNPYAFDLVLLDIVMPGLDGVEVLSRVKQHPVLSKIPVVMLSGLEDKALADICIKQGAAQVAVKPLRLDDIIHVIKEHIFNGPPRQSQMVLYSEPILVQSSDDYENSCRDGLPYGSKVPNFMLHDFKFQPFSLQQYFRLMKKTATKSMFILVFLKMCKHRPQIPSSENSQIMENILSTMGDIYTSLRISPPDNLSIDQVDLLTVVLFRSESEGVSNETTESDIRNIFSRMLSVEMLPFRILFDTSRKDKSLLSSVFGEKVDLFPLDCGTDCPISPIKMDLAAVLVDKNCHLSSKWYGSSKDFRIIELFNHNNKIEASRSSAGAVSYKSSRMTGRYIDSVNTGKRATVMVVDDSNISLKLAVRKLASCGHRTVSAENGAIALELLNQSERIAQTIDLILLDIVMPVMDGIEMLNTLKSNKKFKNIGVVMFSGLEDKTLADVCIECGAIAVLPKPLDIDKVQKLIELQLSKQAVNANQM